MKGLRILLFVPLALCGAAFAGGESGWTVTEVAGRSDVSDEGQVVRESREIRNGVDGRLQIDSGKAVFRLGANSSAVVGGVEPGIRLRNGSCLFADLPAAGPLRVRLGEREVEITRGTGFARKMDEQGQSRVAVGCIAGKMGVSFGGRRHRLGPGELCLLDANGSLARMDFDLARQMKTCALLSDFKSVLPNYAEVQREATRFAALEKRGFIRSGNTPAAELGRDRREMPSGVALDDFAGIQLAHQDRAPIAAPNPPQTGGIGVIIVGPGYSGHDAQSGLPPFAADNGSGPAVVVRPGTQPPGPPPGLSGGVRRK